MGDETDDILINYTITQRCDQYTSSVHTTNSTAGNTQENAKDAHISLHLERRAHHAAKYRTIGLANRLTISATIANFASASGPLGSKIKTSGLHNAYLAVGQCVSELADNVINTANANPPIVHRPQNVSDRGITPDSRRTVPVVVPWTFVVVVVVVVAVVIVSTRRLVFMNGALPRCSSKVSQNVSQNARFFSSSAARDDDSSDASLSRLARVLVVSVVIVVVVVVKKDDDFPMSRRHRRSRPRSHERPPARRVASRLARTPARVLVVSRVVAARMGLASRLALCRPVRITRRVVGAHGVDARASRRARALARARDVIAPAHGPTRRSSDASRASRARATHRRDIVFRDAAVRIARENESRPRRRRDLRAGDDVNRGVSSSRVLARAHGTIRAGEDGGVGGVGATSRGRDERGDERDGVLRVR